MKKIAFLVLAHTDAKHFKKLIQALDYNCDIYVHIDKKSDLSTFKAEVKSNNVFFLEDRIYVSWASISTNDAELKLIKEALKQKNKYSHAIFLSGADYPIKSMKEIYNFFSSQPNREFIKFIDMRNSPQHYMKQISQKWFKESFFNSNNPTINTVDKGVRFILNKLKIKNKWDSEIIPYFGSNWCALTMNCCEYVYNYHKKNTWYRKMNIYTFSPEEHFIHTIVGNSPFKESSIGVQKYEGRGTYRLANLHILDKSLSKWYTIDDWQEIIDSDKLFVRKVRSADSSELISRINRELLGLK